MTLRQATAAYQTLFARTPGWTYSGDGADRALFTLDNMSLELVAPNGEGAGRRSHPQRWPSRARDWRASVFVPMISRKCIAGSTG